MTDRSRLDELKRRLELDPSSLAFAQLAEEYRRAGLLREAIHTCRAGLARHPQYLSARVILARCLSEAGDLDRARLELERVLEAAPDNLAAVRGMAELHQRREQAVDDGPVQSGGRVARVAGPAAAARAGQLARLQQFLDTIRIYRRAQHT